MSHPAPAEQQDTANSALADRSDKTPCTSPRRHRGRRYPNRIPTMPQTAQTKPHAPVRAAHVGRPAHPAPPPPST
jgi:hypothetical protein